MQPRLLPSGQAVYDPRGTVTTPALDLAERLPSLKGVRLGVLDNTKWNASTLLRETVRQLQEGGQIGDVTVYRKESFSRVATPDLIQEISEHSDAVLTAIGD